MSRIVKLTAENFKRLVAVEIEPDGNVVVISGANGHGKTSVLDAITAALVGQQSAKLDMPIRAGSDEAVVSLDMGEFIVTRKWKGDKSSLEVALSNGAVVSSPRRFLDDLIGKLSFDPLAFAEADSKEQRKTLLDVAGLADDETALAGKRQAWYGERTIASRQVKELTAQLAGLAKPDLSLSLDPVDTSEVSIKLRRLEEDESAFGRLRDEAQHIDQQIAALQASRVEVTERGRALYSADRVQQIGTLRSMLENATAINRNADLFARRDDVSEDLGAAQSRVQECATVIAEIDQQRIEMIADADLPIDGLGVDDDGVTLNGVPFSQASAAERMRTSIAIAMRLNPDVRVVRVADASLLDSVNRALIEQMAADNDFQVWLEVVDETKGIGFVIEDGRSL